MPAPLPGARALHDVTNARQKAKVNSLIWSKYIQLVWTESIAAAGCTPFALTHPVCFP